MPNGKHAWAPADNELRDTGHPVHDENSKSTRVESREAAWHHRRMLVPNVSDAKGDLDAYISWEGQTEAVPQRELKRLANMNKSTLVEIQASIVLLRPIPRQTWWWVSPPQNRRQNGAQSSIRISSDMFAPPPPMGPAVLAVVPMASCWPLLATVPMRGQRVTDYPTQTACGLPGFKSKRAAALTTEAARTKNAASMGAELHKNRQSVLPTTDAAALNTRLYAGIAANYL